MMCASDGPRLAMRQKSSFEEVFAELPG